MNKHLKRNLLLASSVLVGMSASVSVNQQGAQADEKVPTTSTQASTTTTDVATQQQATDQSQVNFQKPAQQSTATTTDTQTYQSSAQTAPQQTNQTTQQTSQTGQTSAATQTAAQTSQSPQTNQTTQTTTQPVQSSTSSTDQTGQGTYTSSNQVSPTGTQSSSTTTGAASQQQTQAPTQSNTYSAPAASTGSQSSATTTNTQGTDDSTTASHKTTDTKTHEAKSSESDKKSQDQSKDSTKSEKKAIKSSHAKATNVKKEYLTYEEAKQDSKAVAKTVYIETDENNPENTKYYEFIGDEDGNGEYKEITDQDYIDEINEVKTEHPEKVSTNYADKGDLKKFLDDENNQDVVHMKGYYIVRNADKLPDGIDVNQYIKDTVTTYLTSEEAKTTDGAQHKIVVQDGEQYFEFDQEDGCITTNDLTKEVTQANDAQKVTNDYAKDEELEKVVTAYEENESHTDNGSFEVKIAKSESELPTEVQGQEGKLYRLKVTEEYDEYKRPGTDQKSKTEGEQEYRTITYYAHKDPSLVYLYENGKFVEVSLTNPKEEYKDEVKHIKAARKEEATLKQFAKNNEANVNAIKEAVETNVKYITVNDQIYRIDTVDNNSNLDEDAAAVQVITPVSSDKTDLLTNERTLKRLDTVNPGIKISLIDYSLGTKKNGKEIEKPKEPANLGINKGHSLKFSTGDTEDVFGYNLYDRTGSTQNIVSSKLGADGYPVVVYDTGKNLVNESLKYLFDKYGGSKFATSYLYKDKAKLFIAEGHGSFSIDSAKNHIKLNDDKKDFDVYNKSNNRAGQANRKEGMFFPLDSLDTFFEKGNNQDYTNQKQYASDKEGVPNHYFGMHLNGHMVYPEGGMVEVEKNGIKVEEEMVFNFSGDDDFWLFIDDKLVLDLGGIHKTMKGSINFANGKVTQQIKTNDAQTQTTEKYEIIDLKDILGEDWAKVGDDYEINVFYLERGHDASNFKVDMNLLNAEKYYASQTSFLTRTVPEQKDYVYGVRSEYGVLDTSNYTYATNDQYGVKYTEDPGTVDPPVGPENPGPENPGTPVDPELPIVPEVPETPQVPETPVDPEEESTPDEVEVPEALPGGDNDSNKQNGSSSNDKQDNNLYLKVKPNGQTKALEKVQAMKADDAQKFKYVGAHHVDGNGTVNLSANSYGENSNVDHHEDDLKTASMLPQTGDEHATNWLALLGLSMLGLLGMAKLKKKRQ